MSSLWVDVARKDLQRFWLALGLEDLSCIRKGKDNVREASRKRGTCTTSQRQESRWLQGRHGRSGGVTNQCPQRSGSISKARLNSINNHGLGIALHQGLCTAGVHKSGQVGTVPVLRCRQLVPKRE